jgi:hypothetical protein
MKKYRVLAKQQFHSARVSLLPGDHENTTMTKRRQLLFDYDNYQKRQIETFD